MLTKIGLTTIFADAKNPRIKDRIVSVQRRGALLGGGISRIFYQSLPILLPRLASYGGCGAEARLRHADRLGVLSGSLSRIKSFGEELVDALVVSLKSNDVRIGRPR